MKITVYGIVQGVGFRPTVYRVARAIGLKGYVINNGSNVENHVDRDGDRFLAMLKKELPVLARIDRADFEDVKENLGDFSVCSSQLTRMTTSPSCNCASSRGRRNDGITRKPLNT